MLTICDQSAPLGRRGFLRIGSLGLGGLALPHLLAGRAAAAPRPKLVKDLSVIFLFLHGGPSQTETFDPKMTAPPGIRSVNGEIATPLPGITFGSTFERLAPLASKFAVVRSFKTGDGNHDIKPVVSRYSSGASLGAIYARVAGTNVSSGMPASTALYPPAVDPTTKPTTTNFGRFGDTGALGSAYSPFVPGTGGSLEEDMKLHLPLGRLDDRKALLTRLDRARLKLDAAGLLDGMDSLRSQAFSTVVGGVAGAFDLSRENPRTVARYDTAPLVRPENISRRWNNYSMYVDNAKSLGKLLLLARRLCEAGCGFVTVTTNFVWDMHADVNNAGVEEGMRYMGLPLDYALSAFIEDVEARGLKNKILLIACGEMGRTPKINNAGGRDHWGNLAPLLIYGGGLRMGQVIGESTRNAGEPLTQPTEIKHLLATVMHSVFDVSELRIAQGMPAEIVRTATAAEPIAELGLRT